MPTQPLNILVLLRIPVSLAESFLLCRFLPRTNRCLDMQEKEETCIPVHLLVEQRLQSYVFGRVEIKHFSASNRTLQLAAFLTGLLLHAINMQRTRVLLLAC